MAHFAELDSNNIVLRVIVISNDDVTDLSTESEDYVAKLVGSGTWKQTSYNNKFRGKYAGIGDTYDAVKNAFIPAQPYPSWTLNESTWSWDPPTPKPEIGVDDRPTIWDEASQSWLKETAPGSGVFE